MFNGMNGLEILKNWPRYDTGEPLKLDDEVAVKNCEPVTVRFISFDKNGFSVRHTSGCRVHWFTYGERVKRPAPKVLDADGAEIRVGDKLYDTDTGCGRTVRAINASGTVEFEGCEDRGWFTRFLTHRAPVLAADGRPLREGETVWDVDGRGPLAVWSLPEKSDMHVSLKKDGTFYYRHPDQLTHERPDSWERVMADAESIDRDLRGFDGDVSTCADLVRRAKALAGVSE